ncbi:MAG: DUF448 domain-containing protein [Alphaproteobacteria bacterium]|nr:DUF448 domain-containing protein [Alphaproteobacteria bacterium]
MLTAFTPSDNETVVSAVIIPPTARRCLVTGEIKPKDELIRFVLGPESVVFPDLAARLPGRGLWVSARRDLLAQAIAKNMFSRAAKTKAVVPSDLLEQTERLLARRCLELLGLARSAGAVVTGQPQVEHALSHDELAFLLMASDAGRDCRKKLSRANILDSGFSREELGAALGHEHLASVGLRPHPLTKKLKSDCVRWQGVRAVQMSEPNDKTNADWIADEHD